MRADELLLKLALAPSRSVAQALILAGKVRSGPDAVVNKPSQSFPEDTVLIVDQPPRFVSRGGEKLEGALDHFKIPVEGLTVSTSARRTVDSPTACSSVASSA